MALLSVVSTAGLLDVAWCRYPFRTIVSLFATQEVSLTS